MTLNLLTFLVEKPLSGVAQLVEQVAVNHFVGGSSPSSGASYYYSYLYNIIKVVIILSFFMMVSCQEYPEPPQADSEEHQIKLHGHTRIDPYYWMRLSDDQKLSDDPDAQTNSVLNYIKRESEYKNQSLAHTSNLQNNIFNEIINRIEKEDISAPYFWNGYFYYRRYEHGKEYAIYCRKKGSLESTEQILIDENLLSQGHDYFSLGDFDISPDNQWMVYSVDTLSRRIYELFFKNLITGETLLETVPNTTGSVAWANDSKTLFYTSKNKLTLLSEKIYRHVINEKHSDDQLVYVEKDNSFYTSVYRSKSGKFIIISSSSTLITDYHLLLADNPYGELLNFTPRQNDHEYSIAHHENDFFILSNKNAPNNRLMRTSDSSTNIANWEEVIPHDKDIHLLGMEVFKNHLAINERRDGLLGLRVLNLLNSTDHVVRFDEKDYSAYFSKNFEMRSNVLRYTFNSMKTPRMIVDYNMDSREKIIIKQQNVIGGYNPKKYFSTVVYATARDGEKIPIYLVYNISLKKKNQPQPLLLYGYGSYGDTEEPYFSIPRLSLLDRGFIYAVANIRGSQVFGRRSYEDGKMLNKKNTFYDFIDAAKHLVENDYTSTDLLFCEGGSAGGLLIGAVINMEPGLWKGAVVDVPFVDVVTTMMDPTIPLTSNEWEEWGDPRVKEEYEYMLSYSPYDQIKKTYFPNMLVTAGFFDSQVQYWEPLKYVAKLREHWQGKNRLYFHINMEAGHSGKSGRFQRYKDYALSYAFILDLLDE